MQGLLWNCSYRSHKAALRRCFSFFCRRNNVFDQCQFCSGLELTKVDLIHERSDEEDTAAGAAQKILRSKWIGKILPIDAFALIGDRENQ